MIHIQSRGSLFISNSAWHIHYTIMKMSVNEVSAIFGLARWVNKALRRWMSAGQNCSLPLKPKNTMYNKKNTDSKILNIAHCKICKMWLLAAKYLILVIYNYPTATTSTWYKSTDGPADNPDDQFRNGTVLNWTQTQRDGLEPLLTLHLDYHPEIHTQFQVP